MRVVNTKWSADVGDKQDEMGSDDGTGGRGARSHAVEFVGIATTFSGGVGVEGSA